MTQPLVELRQVKKTFHHLGRPLEVLKGIDLQLHRGELAAIVGPSGAGKSTLLHCLGTLDLPTSGQIMLEGQDITALPGARLSALRNKTIGFVFQFHHLLPEFTALENVQMPGLIHGQSRSETAPRARQLLKDVGLAERATHRPGELSGGEQQRVALARALFMDPPILLADEPTGNLDSATSDAIHDLFLQVNRERGTTIVVVTHNVGFAERMPRIIRLRDGFVEKDVRRELEKKQAEEALP
ncbi:MAG TPA: ABC transporter ATP-binding protein [Polyangiaceae bacterium]|nr:MAG: Lipoprotein-releasing system ATP-binding protein LolD [Deltaproteobacteria bacterium ADurb.Bin207]HNS97660.1 ABC transporter ATP-binding protein [Polyangiaceae bacterium]HNZ24824.1 ABC transporter ATP-binding protein [Polyangiaceae bacterium]HOD25259.1 ABC transporter ATP-binding protein [Polyangiaceae bacterium]HOE48007.1 ABC transporter ATP-binding protein [Polyangiaceae bacterium]